MTTDFEFVSGLYAVWNFRRNFYDLSVSFNIFSVKTPHPIVGSFTITCITFPTIQSFCKTGELDTRKVNMWQHFSDWCFASFLPRPIFPLLSEAICRTENIQDQGFRIYFPHNSDMAISLLFLQISVPWQIPPPFPLRYHSW